MKEQEKEREIPFVVIRSKRKTLSLTINADAELVIRAPLYLPDKRIREFVDLKKDWIRRRVAYARQNKPVEKYYRDGEKLLYLGEEFSVSFDHGREPKIDLQDRFYLNPEIRERVKGCLIAWYIHRGYQIIPQRVTELAELHNFQPVEVKITRAERRWGSCSHKGSLCFSWRLMMAPPSVVDYVIIHELVHLEIRDHSSRFWKRVQTILPDFAERRIWLRENDRYMRL